MNIRGLIIIFIAVAIPWIWYGPLIGNNNATSVLGQYLGAAALILMGITQLLATRFRGIEAVFGSMDRVYVLHKWLAIVAVVMAFLHENLDPELDGIELVRNLGDMAEGMGEVAYNGFLVLVIVSLITIIPYKYWKWSHRLIGIFFALASFHFIFIEKPFSVFDLPGLYIGAFCVIGIISYVYLLIPRGIGHNSTLYQVADVVNHGSVTEFHLLPQGKGITHKAGQFAFVNFNQQGLGEIHPFTISSAPQTNGNLRFMVKELGGYTKQLGQRLKPGATASVSNPFGHFSLQNTYGPQVWIGAGIGITPFMAWLDELTPAWSTPTHLYYCVRSQEDALLITDFEAAAERIENFEFTLVVSQAGNRLTADQIVEKLGQDIRSAHVYFCGPAAMRDALKRSLSKRGLPAKHFHYEEFEIRSSLGIVGLVRRVIPF